MPRFTARDAERLSPEQAAALVRVLDLQAQWDALLGDRGQEAGLPLLRDRQRASDAYRAALRDYAAEYRDAVVPEPTQAVPGRVAAWCRVLRAVFLRAAGGSPAAVVGRVYRLADRAAARVGKDPVGRGPADDLSAGVRELDAVIAWCDGLAPPAPPLKPRQGDAA